MTDDKNPADDPSFKIPDSEIQRYKNDAEGGSPVGEPLACTECGHSYKMHTPHCTKFNCDCQEWKTIGDDDIPTGDVVSNRYSESTCPTCGTVGYINNEGEWEAVVAQVEELSKNYSPRPYKHVLPSDAHGADTLESEHITEERKYHEYQTELRLMIESLHRAFTALYERPVYDSHTQSLIRTARETLQRLQSKLGV